MRLKSTLATVLLAALVSFAVTYGVNTYPHPVRATSDDPFEVLNLSAEQKEKIHQVAMAHHPRLVSGQASVDSKRQELAALLATPGALDEAAVSRTLQEVARLESDLDQEVARNLVEMRPLLTTAQQQALFQQIQLRHPRNPRQNGGRP